jgi:hypothetical protein
MRTWWIFGVCLCVGVALTACAGWALGLLPAHIPYCSLEQGHETCATYNVAFFTSWKLGDFLNWISPAITAAATGAIAWLTKRLWQINLSQLQHGRKVERAYLHGGGEPIGNIAWTENGVVKNFPTFRLDINNHGKTPGELLEYGIGWCKISEVDSLPLLPEYKWYYYRDFVQSNAPRAIKPLKMPSDWDINETVIFGRFGYCDIFGERHSNGFIQHGGKPIRPPHISYVENDPPWDLPNVGGRKHRKYEQDETASALVQLGRSDWRGPSV